MFFRQRWPNRIASADEFGKKASRLQRIRAGGIAKDKQSHIERAARAGHQRVGQHAALALAIRHCRRCRAKVDLFTIADARWLRRVDGPAGRLCKTIEIDVCIGKRAAAAAHRFHSV